MRHGSLRDIKQNLPQDLAKFDYQIPESGIEVNDAKNHLLQKKRDRSLTETDLAEVKFFILIILNFYFYFI